MKVRIVQQLSGARSDGYPWPPAGTELTLGDAEGADLCAVGIAEPVAEHRQAETPVPPEPETREDKTPAEEAAPVPEPVPEPEPEPADEVDETAAIREWARSQGIPVGVRGRIPQDVRDRYHMEKS